MSTASDQTYGAMTTDPALDTFVHRWAEAIAENDVERMERFVTDDWMLVDVGGQVDAVTFHRLVREGTLRHDSMTHEVVSLRRLSPDVAIITTHCTNTGAFQEHPLAADEWTTDVVVRSADGWRCVLTQLTPRRVPAG
ncbi:MAG: nuclear transport factor 2 family protein [Actinobacteria bacterium]|nr:nuclear transport factor 2 family protein [Actinomycetota bacterium]